MPSIQRLSDDVINKIAAGEVVERPASVVKELVENALDAGARNIRVELRDGGKELIVVEDDGCGIEADQMVLAVARHATSKLKCAEELFSVQSKGFRGEALAAISSVSRFRMLSRVRQSQQGVELQVDDQGQCHLIPAQIAPGTKVIIEDLFYQLPARKAFLKTSTTEFSYAQEIVQMLSLMHPDVSLSLYHNDKLKFEQPRSQPDREVDQVGAKHSDSIVSSVIGEAALRQRLAQVWKPDLVEGLIYHRQQGDHVDLEFLVSPPGAHQSHSRYQAFFVNGRWVKDRSLKVALQRAYHSHLLPAQHPVVLLSLWLPSGLVDVNVHPAKSEVRLQYSQDVQSFVAMSIREQLRSAAWSDSSLMARPPTAEPSGHQRNFADAYAQNPRLVAAGPGPREFKQSSAPSYASSPGGLSAFTSSFSQASASMTGTQDSVVARRDHSHAQIMRPLFETSTTPHVFNSHLNEASGAQAEVACWHDLEWVGSAFDCYLIFKSQQQLLIVDQHAWHERILYELLINDSDLYLKSQPLLIPETLELSNQETEVIDLHLAKLMSLGFVVKVIGEGYAEVLAIPVLLSKRPIEGTLRQIFKALSSHDTGELKRNLYHEIYSTMACHAAVRAGESLDQQDLQRLKQQAEGVDFYHNCPHGRPVFKSFSETQIASWFER